VLHYVDKDTKFNSASFLPGESVDDIWRSYQLMWLLRYVGHPEELHGGQGPQFYARNLKGLCNLSGIRLVLSGVESHNSLGEGERYHAYLRHIYHKVRADFPKIGKEYALQIAVKSLNDTAGPNGLVPNPTCIWFAT